MTEEEEEFMAHPTCQTVKGHVCQEPSGKPCIERGCNESAGTFWGPMWCPEHDQERLERVSKSMDNIMASFDKKSK